MSAGLACDDLVKELHRTLNALPDDRKGKNTPYAIQDAALGAFAVFFTQSPSVLAYQRTMQQAKGRSNAESLFGVATIPGDHQLRTRLDPVDPGQLFPVFQVVYHALDRAGLGAACRAFAGQRLMALDGTEYFSSPQMCCATCSQRAPRKGGVTYFHHVITPVLVAPGKAEVITLEPEFITPPDGQQQQDGEQVAAKRWTERHAGHSPDATILGDDLSCKQPFCELL